MPLGRLIRLKSFPAVVHPRHAREALGAGGDALAEWTGGYAITVPEHRAMLEDFLGALAWKETGQAVLVNGLYGAGKSHLLVLLHLLAAHHDAWTPFLDAHPAFRRYATALQGRRWLPVHFSLDEYGPGLPLETVVERETARALAEAGVVMPEVDAAARGEAWAGTLAAVRTAGYFGLLLLIDELSLFLAGRSPAQREADAAFLQFLAGATTRAPLWLIGAQQRALADVGPLRTHSWRQVEDRFRRYTLSPQQIGDVLRQKLLQREDPATIRTLVAGPIAAATEAALVPLPVGELHTHWPFHPASLDLLQAVVNGALSPQRGAVDVLQRLLPTLLDRPADCLITPLDLFSALEDDLRREERLAPVWSAVDTLSAAARALDDPLVGSALHLLTFLHLANQEVTMAQLHTLAFNGQEAPTVAALSTVLHTLRRRGAYLAVIRDADPEAEIFSLAVRDDAGALAFARMQERRQECLPGDPRVSELALASCRDTAWPFATALQGLRHDVPWCGAPRAVIVLPVPALTPECITQAYQAIGAGQGDAAVLLPWPGLTPDVEVWRRTTAILDAPDTATLALWLPRALTAAEGELWAEYAAWERAAGDPNPPASPRERKARQRCLEQATALRPAVGDSVRTIYLEGQWCTATGREEFLVGAENLTDCLARMLAPGLECRYPLFPRLSIHGVPSRVATQQLLTQLLEPGEAPAPPGSLLAEYIERYALPMGWVEWRETTAVVTPPPTELLDLVLARCAETPLRFGDAVLALQRPPYGCTLEQARLLLTAAVRSGALQGVDAFLHSLDPDNTSVVRSDALAFVVAPPIMPTALHPLLRALAARWAIPLDPWPVACSQVCRRLRGEVRGWHAQTTAWQALREEWGTLADDPWHWTHCDALLALLPALANTTAPEALLSLLGPRGDEWVATAEALTRAQRWWTTYAPRLVVLRTLPLPAPHAGDVQALCQMLAGGEASFPQLSDIGTRLDAALAGYALAYCQWHDACFGVPVITALRQVFDTPAFRAVKALARLPMPVPEAAQLALTALAAARAGYCPGVLTQVEEAGVCTRCRLPWGSPSPLPDAHQVTEVAHTALAAYAVLLRDDPWVAETQTRLTRAPAAIAAQVRMLLGWRPAQGPETLLATLDDAVLAWCGRDTPAAGTRRLAKLHATLAAHDLTLAEARRFVTEWLDPEGTLNEESVLAFE